MKKLFIVLALLLSGCAAPNLSNDRASAFERAAPRSILLVPVAGQALDPAVPGYVLSTVAMPLAEKGFYVFPVDTATAILQQQGASPDARALSARFGADAVLFVDVNQWNAEYEVFTTTVTVDFSYSLVSKDGTLLWSARKQAQYNPDDEIKGNIIGNLISSAISAAIVKAHPNFLPLAHAANREAFFDAANGIPDGPYLRKN
jgi:hypothetical protein